MLKDIQWPIDRTYKSKSEFEPLHFYLKGLQHSQTLYLQLGYFSSAAIHLLSYGFAHFIARGGQVHLIINHFLSDPDKALVSDKYQCNTLFDILNPVKLQQNLSLYDQHFFECLAYLIKEQRLSFTIIRPKDSNGIAHYKSGLFYDGTHYVGYTASCNFTLYGLTENLEHLSVDLDWDHDIARTRNQNKLNEIQQILTKKNSNVDYLDHTEIESIILNQTYKSKDLNELLLDANNILQGQIALENNTATIEILSALRRENQKIANIPRFPYSSGPRDYQKDAYLSWCQNNKQGIFAMATGTGKTITSLNCLLNEYIEEDCYQSIIVVPTKSLVNQWSEECRKFNFNNIILISSDHDWEPDLDLLTANFILSTKQESISFIIITTYASLISKKFSTYFHRLPSSTLLIADEVHNMGGTGIKKILPKITFKKRIGLSATPERIYDEEGEQDVFEFFRDSHPFTYAYTMKEAIDNGILCKYYYQPIFVRLTIDEQDQYNEFSKKISKLYIQLKNLSKQDDISILKKQIEKLFLLRKRIVHQAENKLSGLNHTLKLIMESHFHSLKYTLVYSPEGMKIRDEEGLDFFDDEKLINTFTRAISQFDNRVIVRQFTGATKDRDEILDSFCNGNTDVLVSMRCLDEGVDIPKARQAIFCSSTGNPRQFIQRRGRILRSHSDKEYAVIYDLVVLPEIGDSITFSIEKGLIRSELKRVYHFASLSMNHLAIINQLEPILAQYDISLSSLNEG